MTAPAPTGAEYDSEEYIHLPRRAVRLPVEWRVEEAFDPDDAATWPDVPGRLEYVGGRMLYMPPCGEEQQDVATDVARLLASWSRARQGFVVGSNEAGMLLGGEVRGADAAIWRSADVGKTTKLRRSPPILAVEVAGEDEGEAELRVKADWYFAHGVEVVWLVLPGTREVVVLGQGNESRHARGATIPEHPALPGLVVPVSEVFWQIDRA